LSDNANSNFFGTSHDWGALQAHHTNLVMQTQNHLSKFKILLQQIYSFIQSPKWQLEFEKLTKVMKTKKNKVLLNVHTKWINMFSRMKQVMEEYHTLLIKMAFDKPKKVRVIANLDHLVDVEVILGLSCGFPLLEAMYNVINFSQL
jgi:hypothetical protein